jgi:hypothetical protein
MLASPYLNRAMWNLLLIVPLPRQIFQSAWRTIALYRRGTRCRELGRDVFWQRHTERSFLYAREPSKFRK